MNSTGSVRCPDTGGGSVARFRVHQNGLHDRLQISANARSVVVEYAGYPGDIRGRGIAGHQVFDQVAER